MSHHLSQFRTMTVFPHLRNRCAYPLSLGLDLSVDVSHDREKSK